MALPASLAIPDMNTKPRRLWERAPLWSRAMPEPAEFSAFLTARGLAVARGGRVIVESANVDLAPGNAIILRGPNGAGKTTLLRALAGLLTPAAGTVTVSEDDARVFCGTLNGAKSALSVDENLKFWTALYGTPLTLSSEARTALGLCAFAARPAGQLSTGYGRRLGLARLLVANRPLWLIDEPTAALDTNAARTFEALLAAHRAKGGAAIIATHEPLEAPGAQLMELSS